SVHSGPDRFRRRPIPTREQDPVSSSNLAWPRGIGVAVCLCALAFSACQYEVPITSGPTRKVQERLLGDWTSDDGKEKLKLRRLDDSVYIVRVDILHARKRCLRDIGMVSAEQITVIINDRKYALVVWKLSDDGKRISLRNASDKVIPKETRNSAMVVSLLTKNASNPELFGDEIEFRREK